MGKTNFLPESPPNYVTKNKYKQIQIQNMCNKKGSNTTSAFLVNRTRRWVRKYNIPPESPPTTQNIYKQIQIQNMYNKKGSHITSALPVNTTKRSARKTINSPNSEQTKTDTNAEYVQQ